MTAENKPENLTEFSQKTTLHGVRFLSEQNVLRKLFWIVCLLGAAGIFFLQLKESVDYFLSRPYSTVLTIRKEKRLEFPAVTVCNLNGIHGGKYAKEAKKRFPNTTYNDIEEDLAYMANDILKGLYGPNFTVNEITEPGETRKNRTNTLLRNLKNFSHNMEDLLLPKQLFSCKWTEKICGSEHFETIPVSRYINCFTFKPSEPEVNITGIEDGLRLRMNIGADWYMPNLYEPFVGMKVLVHPRNEFPMVENYGFLLHPGTHTSCSVRRREIINLEKPYESNCGSKELTIEGNRSYSYSRVVCIQHCLYELCAAECGCRYADMSGDLPLCYANEAQLACVYSLRQQKAEIKQYLDCQNSCQESCKYSEYKTSLSTAQLSAKTMVYQANRFCMTDKNNAAICQEIQNKSKAENIQYFRDNIVSLDVYLEDFYYDEIKQVPVYESCSLIGNIGGNLGLFLGMSILTMAEYIEYVIRRLWHKLRMTKITKVTNFNYSE